MASLRTHEKYATAVLDAAEWVCGSRALARDWFHHEPIDVFDNQTGRTAGERWAHRGSVALSGVA